MQCACPHSCQLSLIGAPMAISLSSDPLLRITLLTEKQKQKHLNYAATKSGGSRHRKTDEMNSAFFSFPGLCPSAHLCLSICWTFQRQLSPRVCILWIHEQESQQGMLKYYIPRMRAIRIRLVSNVGST